MANLRVVEIKAFIPAKDYSKSKAFYQDIGFHLASDDDGIAYFCHGDVSFLLQDEWTTSAADHLMMHLLVENVAHWRQHLVEKKIAETYGVEIGEVVLQPWRMYDFYLRDPSGVRWCIAQNCDESVDNS